MFHNKLLFLLCAVLCTAEDQFEKECGLEAVDSTPLVRESLGGVKANQFPWHVAIFHRKENNQFKQVCGGSLVRSNLVISAAHCFSNRAHSHQIHVADYRIVAGVLSNSWSSTDIGRQQSEVREVRLGEQYGASTRNFQDDISIIRLKTSFTFSDTVRAVCLDLEDVYTNQTSPGTVGKVAGWGLTESGDPSDSLNFLGVPVVAPEECLENLPYYFKSFFTSDKICAGLTNGTAVCQGDSGGGLVFPLQNSSAGAQRWFLRGVLSNAPTSRNLSNPCLANVFALYTNISRQRMWLTTQMDDNLPPGGCTVKGSAGVCREFSACPRALGEAAHGIPPQYCRPASSSKVCCAETCPPLPSSTVSRPKTDSKAENYCLDLAERLYPCQYNGSSWSRKDLCGPKPKRRRSQYRVNIQPKSRDSEKQRYGLVSDLGTIPVYLVSERWLLTSQSDLDNLLGELDTIDTPPSEVEFSLSRTVRHPQYIPGNTTYAVGTNDLLLVEMDRPVPLSGRYPPVCLHTAQDSVGGLSLSRWDSLGRSRKPATLLSQEDCRRKFPPGSSGAAGGVTDSHLCVTVSTKWNCGSSSNYLTASSEHTVACTRLLVGLALDGKMENVTCIELHLRLSSYIPWLESVVWP